MRRIASLLILLLALSFLVVAGCDDDDSTNTTGNNANSTNNTNSTNNANNTNSTNSTNNATVWNTTVTVRVDGTDTPVDLSTLDKISWNGVDAIRLSRVIERAVLTTPWNFHYNFIGNDGYNVLTEKMDGNLAALPYYGELDSGFLFEEEGGLRVGWEESLGFPGSLRVRGMDGGVIELHTISSDQFLLTADGTRLLMDVTAFSTVQIIDYKNPDEGLIDVVPMTAFLDEAPITNPEGVLFKIYGKDGFANNDDNLMPYANMTHAYMEPNNKKLLIEEEYDTQECCWRVHDIVVIKGIQE